MLWQDHISTSEYEFFDSFFRGLVLILNKRVWALCMCVYFIQLIYIQRMAMKKREEVYLQPHIRTDVCVQYSVRNLKYLNKFWKIKVNIPGRRMRSAKPRINEREREVLGIANLPPSASVILILSPWRSCERKDWRICNLTKKVHPDVSATRLVLYSESFVEALQSPNQANLVRFLFQKDLSVVMWRKLRQRDHLKSLFQGQAGANRGSNYPSACRLWTPSCGHATSLKAGGSFCPCGSLPIPFLPVPEFPASQEVHWGLSRNIQSLYLMNSGPNYYWIFL